MKSKALRGLFCYLGAYLPLFCTLGGQLNKVQLVEIATPILDDLGYELWACEYQPQGQLVQMRLFIDKLGEGSFSLDDCMQVSRLLRPILDVEYDMRGEYHLEISSPGVNRKLYTVAQMQRYIGQQVQVRLYAPIDKRKQFKGVLQAATDKTVTLDDSDGNVFDFAQSDIAKVNVVS